VIPEVSALQAAAFGPFDDGYPVGGTACVLCAATDDCCDGEDHEIAVYEGLVGAGDGPFDLIIVCGEIDRRIRRTRTSRALPSLASLAGALRDAGEVWLGLGVHDVNPSGIAPALGDGLHATAVHWAGDRCWIVLRRGEGDLGSLATCFARSSQAEWSSRCDGEAAAQSAATKSAAMIKRLKDQVTSLQHQHGMQMRAVWQSHRYRLGAMLAEAARSPSAAIRLPVRLARLGASWKGRDRVELEPGAGAPAARRPGGDDGSATLTESMHAWKAEARASDARDIVMILGGTAPIQGTRLNRPIRMSLALADVGVPVLFNFHRWRPTDPIPPWTPGDRILQSPTDLSPSLIRRLAREDRHDCRTHLIVSYPHPAFLPVVGLAKAAGWSTAYEIRDDWLEFHKVGAARWFDPDIEAWFVHTTDTVCTVSRPLRDAVLERYGECEIDVLPNGLDPAFVAPGYTHTGDSDTVRIGYFGHLTPKWFDWDAVQTLAKRYPQWRFEIIGHANETPEGLPENIWLPGAMEPHDICRYAAKWSASIIPFKPGALADAVDPIKIYEYLALGLPTVSFRMPQIADYPATETVETVDAFAAALERAVETPFPASEAEAFLSTRRWIDRAMWLVDRGRSAIDESPWYADLLGPTP
jgi:glycosyltransferase involved in cell wall biosynthesis